MTSSYLMRSWSSTMNLSTKRRRKKKTLMRFKKRKIKRRSNGRLFTARNPSSLLKKMSMIEFWLIYYNHTLILSKPQLIWKVLSILRMRKSFRIRKIEEIQEETQGISRHFLIISIETTLTKALRSKMLSSSTSNSLNTSKLYPITRSNSSTVEINLNSKNT